jgi:hypothetical protein
MLHFTHNNCAVGNRMDFGTIGAGAATSLELRTYKVQEVSFGVAVSNLDAEAVFQLEGRIGDYWFALSSTKITVTPTGNPAEDKATGVLVYDHCPSIEAIRCRFLSVGAGSLTPTAQVLAKGVPITT